MEFLQTEESLTHWFAGFRSNVNNEKNHPRELIITKLINGIRTNRSEIIIKKQFDFFVNI